MRFVSCDWGTSNLRLRLVNDLGAVEREVNSIDGTAKLAALEGDRASVFRETLLRHLADLSAPASLPVVLSGMASSTIGWHELPYARVPFALDGHDAVHCKIDERFCLISGLCTCADILRGEETEAVGLASWLGQSLPNAAMFVLPGTHSKHLEVRDGAIIDFQTYMTGELFDLLAHQSVLRHSVDAGTAFDPAPFADGVRESSRPLSSSLFRVRTRQVLDRQTSASNASFLSGILIGTELNALRTLPQRIVIAAGKQLRLSYRTAADVLGLGDQVTLVSSELLSVMGQSVMLKRLLPC
ncbi:MAG: 2-dehydro-3-deoxygalactonokinase [Pedosphaera sp.]|nr:2-dehydro-3-deoxygalactonokinase [Pedosphaera sp.]